MIKLFEVLLLYTYWRNFHFNYFLSKFLIIHAITHHISEHSQSTLQRIRCCLFFCLLNQIFFSFTNTILIKLIKRKPFTFSKAPALLFKFSQEPYPISYM